MTEYGYTAEVPEGYDEAIIRTRLALRGEGFSVLTEMHVGGMLGPEAGDARQYLIMGVFDNAVENRRLDSDLQVAVHLPCNLVIQEIPGGALVAAHDPLEDMEGATPDVESLADQARAALGRVLQRVQIAI